MGNSQTRHVRSSTNLKTRLKTPRVEKNYSSTANRFNPLLPPTHTSQNRLPTENLKSHPSSADLESGSSEKPREKPRGINARNVTSSLTTDKHSTLIVKAQKSNKSLDGSSQDVPTQAQNNSPYKTQVDSRSLLVALIGEKPTLRSCLRIAVMLAKEHRDVSGKFRKHERHACMELYETLGLEEDEMFGPPNELQSQLRQYVFPPPNMHLLKDVAVIDDETMDLILGPEEGALRRSLMDPEQYSVRERRKSSGAMPDNTSTRRAGISSESTFKDGVEAARLGASAAYKCLPKNKEQTAMLTKAMASCVLFKDLDDRDTKILFDSFELELFNADEVVFEKGDDGERFYMISEGMCRIDLPAGPVFLRKGATFGELGILYGTPRAATITACDPSALWFIDRDTYRSVLMRQTLKKRDLHMHFLNSVRILDSMEEYEKARISDTLQSQYAEEGTVICSEGEAGEAMYFIEEGTIQVSAKSGLRTEIQAGGYFGELALLLQCPRKATCIAVTPCRLLRLNRQDFTNALGPLESILRRNLSHYETYITKVTKK